MSFPPSVYKTWVAGETLTAADLNNSFLAPINSNIPEDTDDFSVNAAEMQTTTDPYPSSVESLATSLSEELCRLRYQLKTQLGLTQWYYDLAVDVSTFITNVAGYRKPKLNFVGVTTIDVEENTGTANQTKVLFPDGTMRTVTEDTASTNKYRRFDINATAEFTSGTEDSGLRSGLSEAVNTWYAIYAVKSTIDSTKFVLAGDTTLPTRANVSTLNSRYGTNGWAYLGLIRNGDGGSTTGDILSFVMSGNKTMFRNTATGGNALNCTGILLATTASGTSTSWTYAAGTSGAVLPDNVLFADFFGAMDTTAASTLFDIRDQAVGSETHIRLSAGSAQKTLANVWMSVAGGVACVGSAATKIDVGVVGFIDNVLGVGANPLT